MGFLTLGSAGVMGRSDAFRFAAVIEWIVVGIDAQFLAAVKAMSHSRCHLRAFIVSNPSQSPSKLGCQVWRNSETTIFSIVQPKPLIPNAFL
jgi:hypothetical protein